VKALLGLCLGLVLSVGPSGGEEIVSPDELVATARRARQEPFFDVPPMRDDSRLPRSSPRAIPYGARIGPLVGAEPLSPSQTRRSASPRIRQLTLPELLATTVEKNMELKAAKHSINASHRALQFAKAQQLPTATLKTNLRDSNFDRRFRDLPFGETVADTFGDIFDCHALLSGITLRVPIYHGNRLAALPRAARVKESMEIVQKEKVNQDLILRQVELYVDILLQEKRALLAHQKLDRKEEEIKSSNARAKGSGTVRDTLALEIEADESRQEIVEVENDLLTLKERLARTCGLPRGMDYSLKPEVNMKELELGLDDLIKEARRTNPTIVNGAKRVDLANEELAILNGKDHTTLDFQLDYNRHFILSNTDHDADVYPANLVFAWDVFDGGRNLSEQREGKEKREKHIAELEVATQELEIRIRQAFNLFQESRKRILRAGEIVRRSQQALNAVMEKSDAGVLLPIDLLDAKIQHQKAVINRDRLVNQTVKARARLFHLLGRLTSSLFM